MKKVLSMIVTGAMVLALFSGTAFAGQGNGNGNGFDNNKQLKEFNDMKGHWSYLSVQKMQSYGIFGGYEDGTFRPDKTLTQAELAVIIDRLLEARQNTEDDEALLEDDDDLSDVPAWAKKAVAKGFYKNYFNMKRFHSQVQVDRLTAVVAIAKALKLDPVTDFSNNPFKDRGLISDEDYGYLLALYKEGVISGFPNGNFNPNSFLSRAQMAAILERVFGELEDGNETSDEDNAPVWDDDSIITATAIRATSVDLKWDAADDDDDEVVGYKVSYKDDGDQKTKTTTGKTLTISGLTPDEKYTFTVTAKDTAGNWSEDGLSVTLTTLKEDFDDAAPTWPNGEALTVSSSSSGVVTLIWPDADDNVGIKSYKIYQDGELIKTLDADENSYNVTGLVEGTQYTFKVRAFDAAGNKSINLVRTYTAQ